MIPSAFRQYWIWMGIVILNLSTGSAAEGQLREPSVLPGNLSAEETRALGQRRSELLKQLETHLANIRAHNQRCSHVPGSDEMLVAECSRARARITDEIGAYNSIRAVFDEKVSVAAETRRRGMTPRANEI